jgi:hypothetical protein
MTTIMTLSIFNPNSLLPHRAGVAGLALALSGINSKDAPLQWEVTEDEVRLSWECTDKEAIQWLISQTYQINYALPISREALLWQVFQGAMRTRKRREG